MLWHKVGQRLADAFCITIDLRVLVIVGFGVLDHALEVTFQGSQVGILQAAELVLDSVYSYRKLDLSVVLWVLFSIRKGEKLGDHKPAIFILRSFELLYQLEADFGGGLGGLDFGDFVEVILLREKESRQHWVGE